MTRMVDALYEAFAEAETGGESNPWIRTKVIPKTVAESSTAYGPVQITRSLAENYLKNKKDLFDKEELAYLKRFIKQGQMFARFGLEPDKQGYDPRYDYGGEGDLTSEEDKALYESMAKKILLDHYTRNGSDIEKTIKEWRFGAASKKGFEDDTRYFTKITSQLAQQNPEELEKPRKFQAQQRDEAAPETGYEALVSSLMESFNLSGKPQQRGSQAATEPSGRTDREKRIDQLLKESLGDTRRQAIARGERRLEQTYNEVLAEEEGESFSKKEEKNIQRAMELMGGKPRKSEKVVLRETTNPPKEKPEETEERPRDDSKDPIYGIF